MSPVKCVMYFYLSTFRCTCAVHNMSLFCCSLISWFSGVSLGYCLNDSEMVPVAPIITGITFAFPHSTCTVSLFWGLYILESFQILSWSHFCLQELEHLLTNMFLVYYRGYYYYYYVVIVVVGVSCHTPFLPGTSLEPTEIPTVRLQVSHCSTFRITCDVPSTAAFCTESIECFPGMTFKTLFRHFVAFPVSPVITGVIINFLFHSRCISKHKPWYFSFFFASFCTTFLSAGIVTSIRMSFLSLFLF